MTQDVAVPSRAASIAHARRKITAISRRHLHVAFVHACRLPLYWLRLIARSPYGAARLAGRVHRWATDAAGAEQLAGMLDNPQYHKVIKQRDAKVRRRQRVVLVLAMEAALAAGAALVILGPVAPGWAVAAAGLGSLTLLGAAGRREGDPAIIDRELDMVSGAPRLTSDLIIQALLAIGLGQLNKANTRALKAGDGDGFHIPPPGVIRDVGDAGYRVEIELPPGVTVEQVGQRLGPFAAGLRRNADCVWVEKGKHEGYLILRVTDQAMADIEQGDWPLLKQGRVSMFEPFPFGTDYRGEMVQFCLMYMLMVVGAAPRMGKSFSMRLIAAAAALDPTCQIDLYNLKGGPDFKPLAPVCHRWRTGGDQDEDIAYVIEGLRELHADMQRRYKAIEDLDESVCPEGKTTAELARRRELGLHPRLLMIDEVQKLYEHPEHGAEGKALVIDISKRAPAVGIMVVQATQRVDATSIPKAISSNAMGRFCLKVDSHIENDMVLGTSANKNGYRATDFDFDRDKGVGYLRIGGKPFPARAYKLEAPAVKQIVTRALAVRKAENRLTGYALGEEPAEPVDTSTIVDHLAEVWPRQDDGTPRSRVWWDELARLLAGRYPLYAGITKDAVREGSGLPTVQVKGTYYDDDNNRQTGNRRGAAHEDLLSALAARNTHPDEEPDA